MAVALLIEELRARFGARFGQGIEPTPENMAPKALVLGWKELDAALPDGGLPRGVVELASPRALGGSTSVALAAVRAAHMKDERAWCAWLDPEGTLYAPGVAMAGVDLDRLLIVRPPRADLGRIAVKVAAAGACDVVVIDMDPVPGVAERRDEGAKRRTIRKPRKAWPTEVLVRKLALHAEDSGALVLLLTDSLAPRAVSWPVAMRLELSRSPDAIALSIAKSRRGKQGLAKTRIPLRTRPRMQVGVDEPEGEGE